MIGVGIGVELDLDIIIRNNVVLLPHLELTIKNQYLEKLFKKKINSNAISGQNQNLLNHHDIWYINFKRWRFLLNHRFE